MKDGKEVTEILAAFDLTGSLRAAGELAGCSPNTIAEWVAKLPQRWLMETSLAAG